jgi:hypothetical protein
MKMDLKGEKSERKDSALGEKGAFRAFQDVGKE